MILGIGLEIEQKHVTGQSNCPSKLKHSIDLLLHIFFLAHVSDLRKLALGS